MSDAPKNEIPKGPTAGTDISVIGPDHVKLYRETNGEQGYLWNGATTLIFTVKGRKSGKMYDVPIIYSQVGDKYVIIASKGGYPTHPVWYLNLLENPNVKVQVKADVFDAVARVAESPEREELWAECLKNWPNFDVYQSRTDRKIPVVVFERK